MLIREAKDVRWQCRGDVSCPDCQVRFAPVGREQPILVDEDGRPFCSTHARERSPEFARVADRYRHGSRVRAIAMGVLLAERRLALTAAQREGAGRELVELWQEAHLAVDALPPIVQTVDSDSLRTRFAALDGDVRRVGSRFSTSESPWLSLGAITQAITVGSTDLRALEVRADAELGRSRIPAFHARVIEDLLERMVRAETLEEKIKLRDQVLDALVDVGRRLDMSTSGLRAQVVCAFAFGVVFLGVLAYAGLRQGAVIDDRQFYLLRVVAAVSAAGVASMIPGFIELDIGKGTRFALRAGGALAVFAVVYLANPPELIRPPSAKGSRIWTLPPAPLVCARPPLSDAT